MVAAGLHAMPSSGASAIQQLLAEGLQQIAEVPPEQPEAGVSAFNAFKRGVTQASSGREAPPDQLLADLEPKDVAWRFLIGLLTRKPMYRKQVAAVAAILLHCGPWAEVLRADAALCEELPEELSAALREAEGKLDEQNSGSEDEEEEQDQEVPMDKQRSKRESTTQRALDMLTQGRKAIEALEYSAVKTDDAIDAFGSFQRAVLWAVRSPQKEDDEALEGLKHKDEILSFIIDFYTRKPTHRLRIAALFVRLLGFGNWRAAILADPSVRGAVFEMTKDPGLAEPSPEESQESQPVAIGIDEAMDEAVANGGVGAVYVRVIAAHDLVSGSGADEDLSLHVNVSLGDALRRTDSVVGSLSPQWMSAPFLLQVPSSKSLLRFDVLDSDFDKDESFGSLELLVADLPTEPGSSFSRHALDGVTRGELELEVVFRRAADVPEEAQADGAGGRQRSRSSWLVPAGDQPSLARGWSMTTVGRIFCPAGHEVDEFKEGRKGWSIFGSAKERRCNNCNTAILADGVRWRCAFHCDFNVCDRCHGGAGS